MYTQSQDIYIFLSPDMTRVAISWKSVLYQSTVYKAELKLSRYLPDCTISVTSVTAAKFYDAVIPSSSNLRVPVN